MVDLGKVLRADGVRGYPAQALLFYERTRHFLGKPAGTLLHAVFASLFAAPRIEGDFAVRAYNLPVDTYRVGVVHLPVLVEEVHDSLVKADELGQKTKRLSAKRQGLMHRTDLKQVFIEF